MQHLGESLPLPLGNAFIVHYRTSSCVRFCYYATSIPGIKQEFLVPESKKCGLGCCKFTSVVSSDGSTGFEIDTIVENEDFTSCEDDEPCKGAVYSSSCTFRCEPQ